MIMVHATMASVNGYKVRLFLSLLGKDFTLKELDMYGGEHKQPPFLSLNPFGQMPALEDDGFVVADSHGCLTYLARKYGKGVWLPADPEGMGKVAEWMSKSANEIHQGPWMARAKQRRPDAVALSDEEIHVRCDYVLGVMNGHLYGRDWLAAGHATIADISCFSPISILPECGYKTDKWDNVTAWLGRVRALPGAIDSDGNPF
ncbi:MAG: glutathione S-transferase family protein [Rhodospirillales bacterium]|nr:glutathione S-transferase family protein [Rhodospirillales bacterium]